MLQLSSLKNQENFNTDQKKGLVILVICTYKLNDHFNVPALLTKKNQENSKAKN